jgi:hypothetical protein
MVIVALLFDTVYPLFVLQALTLVVALTGRFRCPNPRRHHEPHVRFLQETGRASQPYRQLGQRKTRKAVRCSIGVDRMIETFSRRQA